MCVQVYLNDLRVDRLVNDENCSVLLKLLLKFHFDLFVVFGLVDDSFCCLVSIIVQNNTNNITNGYVMFICTVVKMTWSRFKKI